MPYSYNVYTGNGSNTQFTIGFPYIRREHVKVYVAYVDTAYTYVNNTTVQLATAPGAGVRVEVRRVTPFANVLVDFADGSTLVAADLDTSNLQHLYLEQELDDYSKQTISIDPATGLLTASGQRITNIANPVNAQDAATRGYVDGVALAGTVPDGNRGDITVSGVGTVWTINNGAIVNADVNASAGIVASKLSFTQSGGSARTVDAKLKDTVSPADFGAVGNNSTDDTSAIAAVRAAFSNTSIDLAGKSYRVTSVPNGWGVRNGLLTLAPANTDDQPANEAYGYGALAANTYIPKQHASSTLNFASGNFNTAFGSYSLTSNTTGRRQTAIGSQALYSNTSGFYNTALGAYALYTNVIGNYNTALGNQALQYCTGSNNAAVGSGALTSLTIGDDNVAIGDRAMGISAQVSRTIAIGTQAGQQHIGNDSIAIGYQALSAPSSSGLYNVAMGSASLGSATTANSNVAVGRRAAAGLTTGSANTAIGNDAMVGSGVACTGSNNVAVGNTASANITTGYQNVSIGDNAGTVLGTGFINVFVGRFAAQATTDGAGNVAIGEQSLSANTTGNYNTGVGCGTVGGTNYTNTTMLGYTATVTGSNQLQLGNASVTSYSYGAVQNRSDARDKADVRKTVLGLDFINALRPVDFRWDMRDDYRTAAPEPIAANATEKEKVDHAKVLQQWRETNALENLQSNGSKKRTRFHHGLIAQEVKIACDSLGIDFGGYQDHSVKGGEDVVSLGYEELIAPLIKAVQELSAEVEQLKQQLA